MPMTAFAQRFPERPLRLIVPVAAGAPADVACRLVADETWNSLGQPIIVENRPGGNSVIAVDAVYNSPADGYTIGCFNVVSLTPALHKSLPCCWPPIGWTPGAPETNRTSDLPLRRGLLYPLSYR